VTSAAAIRILRSPQRVRVLHNQAQQSRELAQRPAVCGKRQRRVVRSHLLHAGLVVGAGKKVAPIERDDWSTDRKVSSTKDPAPRGLSSRAQPRPQALRVRNRLLPGQGE